VDVNVSAPGSHDPLEPEYSILKSRIARRIKYEKGNVQDMNLVDITKVAERVITTVSTITPAAAAVGLERPGPGDCISRSQVALAGVRASSTSSLHKQSVAMRTVLCLCSAARSAPFALQQSVVYHSSHPSHSSCAVI
jgi:hypothetical protein